MSRRLVELVDPAMVISGIASTGPLLPLLDRVPEASRPAIATAAQALLAEDRSAIAAG